MKTVGTKNAWFSFKGQRNDALDVRMLSMPTRPHPARKGVLTDIPGANGKLFQDEGTYDRILVALRCITGDNANIDDVNAWLSGEGDLIFGDEPNRVYHARITKEFSRSNRNPRLRGQEFTVTFDCEPFRYNLYSNYDNLMFMRFGNTAEETHEITNPGTAASAPLLAVGLLYPGMSDENDHPVQNIANSITINGATLEFAAVVADITVYVDCEAKIAYTVYPGIGENGEDVRMLATNMVGGDWPVIPPGTSNITIAGYIDRVAITPRWRWL